MLWHSIEAALFPRGEGLLQPLLSRQRLDVSKIEGGPLKGNLMICVFGARLL